MSTLLKPTIVLSIPATVPVNVGEAIVALALIPFLKPAVSVIFNFKFNADCVAAEFAFASNAVCVAVEIGFDKSVVLSTLPKPTIADVIPLTVPVNVGLAIGAFKSNAD